MYNNPGISKLLALPVERIVGTSLGLYLTGAHKKVLRLALSSRSSVLTFSLPLGDGSE